jgi:hypothetical protein
MDIPEYYRKYQSGEPPKEPKKPETPAQPGQPPAPSKLKPPEETFQANDFTINIYEDWQDKTIYTLTGPVTDGIQHNIVVHIDPDVEVDSLSEYVDWQVTTLEEQLKSCRLLLKEEIKLNNGMPAYRAIFSWYPHDELRIFQEQIFLIADTTAYKLTASFTKKTRKTIGPQVEQMMLSFDPRSDNTPNEQS